MIFSKAFGCSELRGNALKTEAAELYNTYIPFWEGTIIVQWLQPYAASLQQGEGVL